MRRLAALVVGTALCGAAPCVAAAQQAGAPWAYEGKQGPLNWGRLDPAYRACSEGKEQSPIDIRGAHLNKSLQPIEFHYLAGSMNIINTGHWIQVTPAPGSYILANGTRYDLIQFHFHHPGEEAVKGALPDMTLDLVHKSADGKIAVVAVRLIEGNPNAVLAALWEHMPKTEGATDKLTDEMSPAGLLPTDRAYWTYEGSLTAPPCTEGVRWFIFQQEVEISRAQLRQYAALFKVTSRMIQAPHGRKIEASQ